MELLPIIYLSLAIFAVLTVVTIVFSYVSYKIKQSRKAEDQEPAIRSQILDDKKFIGDKPTMYKTKINYIHDKKKTTKVSKQGHRKKHYLKNNSPKEERSKPLKRIEVLNNLGPESNRPNITAQKEFKKSEPIAKDEKLSSLGDNILDKYDDSKDDLYTLDANKKNDKTKGN